LIPVDETPQAVANRLTAKFEEKFASYSKNLLPKESWTTAIRMASVVQREAPTTLICLLSLVLSGTDY